MEHKPTPEKIAQSSQPHPDEIEDIVVEILAEAVRRYNRSKTHN